MLQEYSELKMCNIKTVASGGAEPHAKFNAGLGRFCPHCCVLSPFLSSETHNLPKQPPLAQAVGQAAQCLALMARTGSGSCAFASVDDYLH